MAVADDGAARRRRGAADRDAQALASDRGVRAPPSLPATDERRRSGIRDRVGAHRDASRATGVDSLGSELAGTVAGLSGDAGGPGTGGDCDPAYRSGPGAARS